MANNGDTVYNGFLQRGFSPLQAAVLAGNAQQESSFNPTAVNPTSGAYGLMQWLGPRLASLRSYATQRGSDPSDLNTQMDFATTEMLGQEAHSASRFLSANDIPSANAALRGYLRYGPTEGGHRLDYSTAFANKSAGTSMATPQPQDQDVSRALSILQPAAASSPAAAASNSATSTGAPIADPDVSRALSILNIRSQSEPSQDASPSVPAAGAGTFAGKPVTPGALGNNPMASKRPTVAPAPTGYTPSAVPFLDPVNAGINSLIDNIPFGVGATLTKAGNAVDAGVNNLLGFPTETAADRAAINAAEQKQYPAAAAAGTIAGTVAPYVLAGPESVAAKALGTAADYGAGPVGNMLWRIGASGLSSAAGAAADTAVRGGGVDDMGGHALLAGVAGAASPIVARALGGAGALKAIGAGAATGALIGGGGTALTGGSPDQIAQNALTGAAIGGGIPAAGRAVGTLAGKLVANGVPQSVAQLADLAVNKYGIKLGPAQISGNPFMKMADSVVNRLPLTGGTASEAQQRGAFTGALAHEMGENASTLNDTVMGAAKKRIGGVFQTVANNTQTIPEDSHLGSELLSIMDNAQHSVGEAQMKAIDNTFSDIVNTFRSGNNAITGKQYLSMTAKGSPLDAAIHSSDPAIATAAGQFREALDGALERSASPQDVQNLRQARYQWKVMRTVEDLAEKAPVGEISPPLLMGAVRKNFPNMAYDGGGNMGELARIGQQFMRAPPNSGTPERLLVNKLLGLGGAAGVAGGAGLALNPAAIPGAIGGGIGYAIGAPIVGAAMRSKALANTLITNGLGRTAPYNPTMNMLTRSAVPLLTQPTIPMIGAPQPQ